MKHSLLFLLALISAVQVQAQKTSEILIVSNDAPAWTRLVNAIKPHYPGVITVRSSLPEQLDYDAVMMTGYPVSDDYLDSTEQSRLIDYLRRGGCFYAEGDAFRARSGQEDDTTDNQLWDFIGDSSESWASAGFHVDTVYGVAGSFMTEVRAVQPYDPSRIDFPSLLMRDGMKSVMVGVGNFGRSIAWSSSEPNVKAALLWPIATGYYEEFISRLVCTYFDLCELAAPREMAEPYELHYSPESLEVSLPSAGPVTVVDLLGRIVLKYTSAGDRLNLSNLPKGTYIVTWTSREKGASVIIQR